MDFLDSNKKRAHAKRLFIGYFLMAIMIGLTTTILIFMAYGFGFDAKSRNVVLNGLVFFDSKPEGASIYLNGVLQKYKTNNRPSLPAGSYDVEFSLEGYRSWKKSIVLEGGEVERLSYPFLFPTTIKTTELQTFEITPRFYSQSLGRRWLLYQAGVGVNTYIVHDLSTVKDGVPTFRPIVIPVGVFTTAPGEHSIHEVEWSDNERHLLVRHDYVGGSEFVVVDHEVPEESFNLNKIFNVQPSTVTLRDKKFDQFYFLFNDGGRLQSADHKTLTITPILNDVVAFKTHGSDVIVYAQRKADSQVVAVFVLENGQSYPIRDLAPSEKILLDVARFDNRWYFVVGSAVEGRVFIYRDPISAIKKKNITIPAPIAILKADSPKFVSFSANARFIMLQDRQHFAVYDNENGRRYQYDIQNPLIHTSKVNWMDGHRLVTKSNGFVLVFDFDGTNKQELSAVLPDSPIAFDRDYEAFYNFAPSATAGKNALFRSDLRVGSN